MSGQKIIDGLKAAIESAKCDHDWKFASTGDETITYACSRCNTRMTKPLAQSRGPHA